jgi:type IV pilus modification protein PilV
MRRAFTLLEMLVAALVLAIGLVGTLTLIGSSTRATLEAQDRGRAILFARSKMDEILKEPTVQIGTDQGQDVDQTTDYNWQVAVEQSQNPNLVSVTVTAENRKTHLTESLTTLRRPDVSTNLNADGTVADDSGASTDGTTGTTTGTTGAAGGQ